MIMGRYLRDVILLLVLLQAISMLQACDSNEGSDSSPAGPREVEKSNSMAIYMHYMPWFQSPDVSGYWGSHWRMATANPDVVDANGKRQIASHYYPLIGPYDSSDPDVIEYHLLLMKYAGVDAVLIDWYSSYNVNDYRPLLTASNAIIGKTAETGLKYGLVYEDFTAGAVDDQTSTDAIDAAKGDLTYMQENYFSDGNYLSFDGKPLLMTFGTRYFKQGSQWIEIFSSLPEKPKFVPLWNHGALVGDTDNGEFSWIDFNPDLSELHSFYGRNSLELLIGSGFARFHDYYEEGNWGTSYGSVAYNGGQTLRNTLAKASERNVKHLQLVTWNDFGEGTMLEPTLEDGFTSLLTIMEFTGVSYGEDELRLIHEYYLKKKKYENDPAAREKLKAAYQLLNGLEVSAARQRIEELD